MGVTEFLITILAGFAGTISMSIVMYLYSLIVGNDTKVVHILGTMSTGIADYTKHDFKTLTAGTIGHFGVGMLFAFAYYLLWNWGVFSTEFTDSVWLGAISGIVATIVWNTYFYLHHDPPEISLLHYSVALFLAHVVFAIITVYLFTLMSPNPGFWYELK